MTKKNSASKSNMFGGFQRCIFAFQDFCKKNKIGRNRVLRRNPYIFMSQGTLETQTIGTRYTESHRKSERASGKGFSSAGGTARAMRAAFRGKGTDGAVQDAPGNG